MSVAIVRTLAEGEWRRFVNEHPAGNIFHTPEMFHVFERAKGHRPELWAATRDGRVLALLLPVKITLMGGPLQPLTTRSVAYGSVLCKDARKADGGCPEVVGRGARWAAEVLLEEFARPEKKKSPDDGGKA